MFTQKQIANWFLQQKAMSSKKLQYLLYYAYAWTLAMQNSNASNINRRLFKNDFEAWTHGPVLPEIFNMFKNYGFNDISKSIDKIDLKCSEDVLDIINQVMNIYGDYTTCQLESIVHQEQPWKLARNNVLLGVACTNPISDKEIFSYYVKRLD